MKQYISEATVPLPSYFVVLGAIVRNKTTNGAVTHHGVAITFRLIVAGMIYAFGDISGAHINPSVTIAMEVLYC